MRHQCEWVDCFRDGEYVPADHRTGSICGKPAVDFVLMDPGDDLPPEDEDGHKWWLCAEHYDQWTAPRPRRCTCGVDDHWPCDCTKPDFWDER